MQRKYEIARPKRKYEIARPKRCRKKPKGKVEQVDVSTQTDPDPVHAECLTWKAEAARYRRQAEWFESVRDWVASNGRDSGLLQYLVTRGRVPSYLHWNGEPII